MKGRLKPLLPIGITVFISALSIIGGYWVGYSSGNAAGWVSGNMTASADVYKKAYDEGLGIGFNDGKKDAFSYWQTKGREDAKSYIIEHTKGRLKWIEN